MDNIDYVTVVYIIHDATQTRPFPLYAKGAAPPDYALIAVQSSGVRSRTVSAPNFLLPRSQNNIFTPRT